MKVVESESKLVFGFCRGGGVNCFLFIVVLIVMMGVVCIVGLNYIEFVFVVLDEFVWVDEI